MFALTSAYGFVGHKAVMSVNSKGNVQVKVLLSSPANEERGNSEERLYLTMSMNQFRRFAREISAGDRIAVQVQLSNLLLSSEERDTKGTFLSAFVRDSFDDNGRMVSSGFTCLWSRAKMRGEVPQNFELMTLEGTVLKDLNDALNHYGLLEQQKPVKAGSYTPAMSAEVEDDLPF